MASTTRKIPPSEWDRWKDTILNLRTTTKLGRIVEIMDDTYGFKATLSQFETQLNTWEHRKNLKQEEWCAVLRYFDKIALRGKNCRISISGQAVPAAKLQRIRRRYLKGDRDSNQRPVNGGHLLDLRKVSIETRGEDGKWVTYANLDEVNQHETSDLEPLQANEPPLLETSVHENDSVDDNDDAAANEDNLFNGEFEEAVTIMSPCPRFELSHNRDTPDQVVHISRETFQLPQPRRRSLSISLMPYSSIQQEHWFSNGFEFGPSPADMAFLARSPNNPSTPIQSVLPTFSFHILDDLPFKTLKRHWEASGIKLSTLSPNFSMTQLTSTIQDPIKAFLEDIGSAILQESGNQPSRPAIDVQSVLSSLKGFLTEKDYNYSTSSLMQDEMLGVRLNEALLRSAINGFSCLKHVPIQGIMKYFSRYESTSSLLTACLETTQPHIKRALSENLFRAALENGNENVLKYLLGCQHVDINATICTINGFRYTPMERAVSLRHVGIIKLFLNARADVNKIVYGGALEVLIEGLVWGERITPSLMDIVDLLLEANAKPIVSQISRLSKTGDSLQLASRLLFALPESEYFSLFSSGFLASFISVLDDNEGTRIMTEIIKQTRQTINFGHYSVSGELNRVLVRGAQRGHLQLVKLLLPYSKLESLPRVLSAAIRSNLGDLIDYVLAYRPDIDAPAHEIYDYTGSDDYQYLNATTSYAEAIRAGNKMLIHMIEEKTGLQTLKEGGRFEAAITAASCIGDLPCVRKLLDHCPSHSHEDMTYGLVYAILNGHEEIFSTLLAAGANVNMRDQRYKQIPSPLWAAMSRRNEHIVRDILNADVWAHSIYDSCHYRNQQTSTLEEAVKWGNLSVIQDLKSTFPALMLGPADLVHKEKLVNTDLLENLVQLRIVSTSALTFCLNVALLDSDLELVNRLIKLGASPFDDSILTACVENCPHMLQVFLERIPRTSDSVLPGFGSSALSAAIEQCRSGFKSVDILIDSKIVDISSSQLLADAIESSQDGDHDNFFVIKKLLDTGLGPNDVLPRSKYGEHSNQTALLRALEINDKALIKLLIAKDEASVNKEATLGLKRTPLQKAVEVGSLEIVKLLIEAGAQVNGKPATRGGATALQLAAIRGDCNLAALLIYHGADVEAPPAQINGRWPLEGAAEHGRIEMIEYLWRMSPNGIDEKQCLSAMKLAEENGHFGCRDMVAELSQSACQGVNFFVDIDSYPN